MRVRWFGLAVLVVAGCGGSRAPVGPPKPPIHEWVITTLDPASTMPALVTNGLVGLRLGRDSAAAGPLFLIDAYEKDGEEKILPLANPFGLKWTSIGGKPLAWKDVENYSQRLDMRNGVLTTTWSHRSVDFQCLTAVHPDLGVVAQRWTVGAKAATRLEWRTGTTPGKAPPSLRIANTLASTSDTKLAHTYSASLSKNGKVTFERVASMESKGAVPPFEAVRAASVKAWKKRWETDIVIDGPVVDQQAIRSFLYYLRASIHPKAGRAAGPFGVSSERYFGHVFWDADVWVFPALALIDPEAARTIPAYRLAMAAAARKNYDHWVASGRPVANGKLGGRTPEMPGWDALMYPWESSVSGKETVPGPSRFQHHVTGSVAWGLRLADALGLADSRSVRRVRREATAFYLNRVTLREDGLYSLKSTMSPDEHHTGDDDLYTNVLAQQLFDDVLPKRSKGQSPTLLRPQDPTSLLTYTGDTVRGYKQAAAVLAIYPLQDPGAEKQARTMMDRFGNLTTKNGPAMSDSVHALIWARLGESDKAYASWRASWERYTQTPLMLFSEKPARGETYFTTGAAGCLQTVLHGFLGLRVDFGQEPPPHASKSLRGRAWLSVTPHLPPTWKRATLKNITVLGRRMTLTVTSDGEVAIEGDH